MILVEGQWLDGQSSQQVPATLSVDSLGTLSVSVGDQPLVSSSIDEVKISDRLAKLPRRLSFPGAGSFVTEDNQSIDEVLERFGKTSWLAWVDRIESRILNVALCFVLVVVLVFATVRYGIPYAADEVSKTIPAPWITELEEQTLEQLDDAYFTESKLPAERRQQLKDYFSGYETNERDVVFRDGGKVIGANAFALPGATIIFTDQLVELAKHDEELLAIYFHETGHIKERHGIRGVLQSSVMALFITFITGDGSGVAEVLYTLPIVLTHSAYSRKFENEADDHALAQMDKYQIPGSRFADIMSRLESSRSNEDGQEAGKTIGGYFSSHPATIERISKFSDR